MILGINTNLYYPQPTEVILDAIARTGFGAFATNWEEDAPLSRYKKIGEENGMIFQYLHAPYHHISDRIWEEDDRDALPALLRCGEDCADLGVGILVVHPFIGFDRHEPTDVGIRRFETLLNRAEALGIRVAFENTEGMEYLDAIREKLGQHPALGYCLDTGHQMCYNGAYDLYSRFSEKLICIHLNDNLGQIGDTVSPGGDLHLPLFDGVADFQKIADYLDEIGFDSPMMLEMKNRNKPGRHTHDKYLSCSLEEYLALCYERGMRFAALRKQ